MDIQQAIEYLTALGLWVEAGVGRCYVHTAAEASRGISIARRTETDGALQVIVEDSYVFPVGKEWVFQRWDCIGGRGDDDVEFRTASLVDAVLCVQSYYFGAPLEIAGWIFPTNKHPEWDLAQLHNTFAKAASLTSIEFHAIRHDRYQQFKHQDVSGKLSSFGVRFRQVMAIEPRVAALWMRNDLAEMYFVESGSPHDYAKQ